MSKKDRTIIFISHEAKLLGAPKIMLSIIQYLHSTKKYNILVTCPEEGPFKTLLEQENIQIFIPGNLRKYYLHISQPGSKIYKIFARIVDNIKLFFYFCFLFGKYQNSIIYACTSIVRYIAFPALIMRKKLIWHIQEYSNNPFKQKIHSFLIGYFSTKIVLNSPYLVSKMNLSKRNQRKVEYFRPFSIIKNWDQYETEVADPVHDLFYAGKISIEKGALDLLQAINNIVAMNKNISVAFAGLFVEEEMITNYIAKHNLGKYITFYGFVLDIKKYILNSKIIVLPSYRDNLPTIVLEGLMLEKPVICTDVGDIRSVVTPDQNGILIQPGDVQQLTNAILKMTDKQTYQRFVQGTRAKKAELLSNGDDFQKMDDMITKLFQVQK